MSDCLGMPLYGNDIEGMGICLEALVIARTLDDGIVHHRILTTENLGSVEAAGMLLYAKAIIEADFTPHCPCKHGDLDE